MFAAVYSELERVLKGKTVLIYNSEFDCSMLRAECERLELPCPLTSTRCMMHLYAEYIGDWSTYWHSYRWYPLPGGGHRALEDCKAVLALLQSLAHDVPPSPYPAPSPEQLAALAASVEVDALPF